MASKYFVFLKIFYLFLTFLYFNVLNINKSFANIKNNKNNVVQNKTGNILDGETIYPKQVRKVIKMYKNKYDIDINFIKNDDKFTYFLKNLKITRKPISLFKYSTGHKYGFIFIKYNNIDYCICIDTIPNISYYKNNLFVNNGELFINFNGKNYRAIIFGENIQKAQLGCGYFTLKLLKHLLKENNKLLNNVLRTYIKFHSKDENKLLERDNKKLSCIRGLDFEAVKNINSIQDIYKYSQSLNIQNIFFSSKVGKKNILFNEYRKFYSTNVKSEKDSKEILTKIFSVAQKYKNLNNNHNKKMCKYKNILFSVNKNSNKSELKKIKDYNLCYLNR